MKSYVEKRDGGFWIAGKRISLDSIVYAFQRGAPPESVKRSYPLTTLEEIYGAIAFYLANQTEIDEYLIEEEIEIDEMRRVSLQSHSDWHEKMLAAKRESLVGQT